LLSLWMIGMAPQLFARDRVRVVGSSTPVVESLGTGGGFQLFCAGVGDATPDVTDASRPMTSSETAECARNGVGEVVGIRVGLDGMLLVNAKAAPAFALTREQLYRAVARRVPRGGQLVPNPYHRWREIGIGNQLTA